MIIAIDPSLRSTAIVAMDRKGNLADFRLSCHKKEDLDKEALLIQQGYELVNFLNNQPSIHTVVIEGLSFNALSANKDMLAGLYWRLVCEAAIKEYDVVTVPVTKWRNHFLSLEERRAIKASKEKDGLKKAVVELLPSNVKEEFLYYIKDIGAKKESLYDCADAYMIAQYYLESLQFGN